MHPIADSRRHRAQHGLRGPRRQRLHAALVGSLVVTFASSARADLEIALGAGPFTPWDGNTGYAVAMDFTGYSPSRHWRLGGGLVYRSFETEYFDVEDVGVRMYQVRSFLHYVFAPGARIRPYAGLGVSTSVNVIDGDRIEEQRPGSEVVEDTGSGIGVFGVVGLEMSLGRRFSLYAETTASGDFQMIETNGEIETKNLGGVTAAIGARIEF